MMLTLACVVLLLAAISAVTFLRNYGLYLPLPGVSESPAAMVSAGQGPMISVLIPARNEEGNIGAALQAILASRYFDFQVIVGDDNSDDRTAEIVRRFSRRDPRVRLLPVAPLVKGWSGKQHACHCLASAATGSLLCFVDADVRLAPDALGKISECMRASNAALISGVPRQQTGSWLERLLLPLIHFVLLGYLPLDRMRANTNPAYAAGCGQLMIARQDAYRRVGGHAAIRASLHDGIKLPAAFRRAGCMTDLFDATPLASVRMYRNAREVWDGLGKNATEGMASPTRLPVFTLLLLGGQVLPALVMGMALSRHELWSALLAAIAMLLSYLPRVMSLRRFQQPVVSAIVHPVGILVLLIIQWAALGKLVLGRSATWKGRAYAVGSSAN
jgi:hypothetical protein